MVTVLLCLAALVVAPVILGMLMITLTFVGLFMRLTLNVFLGLVLKFCSF